MTNVNLTRVKSYGDTLNDGKMQFSFTLLVQYGDESKEAAKQLLVKMGIEEPEIVHAEDLGKGFTLIMAYGICSHTVDFTVIEVPKVDVEIMDKYGVEDFIKENIKRDVVIVRATTGTDAHTVGIDAIMNMKGYDGHYGLKRYKGIIAVNMGSQVPNEELLAKAIELVEAEGLRDRMMIIAGGPRINHELAIELGYDAGFGPGLYAEHVVSYVVN